MGNEACTASTPRATILRSISAADKTKVGDPHMGILNSSHADMSFPLEMYKISPSSGGSQLVPSEVQETTQINSLVPSLESLPKNANIMGKTSKKDIADAMIHEESKHPAALVDQTKKNGNPKV